MALSDNNSYSGNGKTRFKEPEVFSGYNLSNVEGVDPSALSFSFFRNLLKIQISPKLTNPSGDRMWDHENAANVYLTHTKARMLRDQIDLVLSGKAFNGGVNSGADSLISFSNGKEVNTTNYCLIIRKIDQSTGAVTSTYVYEFKTDYHYAISDFDAASANYEKIFFNSLEIEQFKDLLEQYYLAMTNSTAYSVINNMRFDMSRINTKLNDIAEANGITYENKGYKNNSSYFNRPNTNESQPNRSAGHSGARMATMEDLENQIEGD